MSGSASDVPALQSPAHLGSRSTETDPPLRPQARLELALLTLSLRAFSLRRSASSLSPCGFARASCALVRRSSSLGSRCDRCPRTTGLRTPATLPRRRTRPLAAPRPSCLRTHAPMHHTLHAAPIASPRAPDRRLQRRGRRQESCTCNELPSSCVFLPYPALRSSPPVWTSSLPSSSRSSRSSRTACLRSARTRRAAEPNRSPFPSTPPLSTTTSSAPLWPLCAHRPPPPNPLTPGGQDHRGRARRPRRLPVRVVRPHSHRRGVARPGAPRPRQRPQGGREGAAPWPEGALRGGSQEPPRHRPMAPEGAKLRREASDGDSRRAYRTLRTRLRAPVAPPRRALGLD